MGMHWKVVGYAVKDVGYEISWTYAELAYHYPPLRASCPYKYTNLYR